MSRSSIRRRILYSNASLVSTLSSKDSSRYTRPFGFLSNTGVCTDRLARKRRIDFFAPIGFVFLIRVILSHRTRRWLFSAYQKSTFHLQQRHRRHRRILADRRNESHRKLDSPNVLRHTDITGWLNIRNNSCMQRTLDSQ